MSSTPESITLRLSCKLSLLCKDLEALTKHDTKKPFVASWSGEHRIRLRASSALNPLVLRVRHKALLTCVMHIFSYASPMPCWQNICLCSKHESTCLCLRTPQCLTDNMLLEISPSANYITSTGVYSHFIFYCVNGAGRINYFSHFGN